MGKVQQVVLTCKVLHLSHLMICSVREIPIIEVFATGNQPTHLLASCLSWRAGLPLIMTQTHIFHVSQ